MVTKDQIRAMALSVVRRASRDRGLREAAQQRAAALGVAPAPIAEVPGGATSSRTLHEARVAVESPNFELGAVRGMLASLLGVPSYASEAHVVLAAAQVREARRLRRAGDVEGAARSAMDALTELSDALSADLTNREGLVLLDEIETLTGYSEMTRELRMRVGA